MEDSTIAQNLKTYDFIKSGMVNFTLPFALEEKHDGDSPSLVIVTKLRC